MSTARVVTIYLLAFVGFWFGEAVLIWAALTISAYSTIQICKEDDDAVRSDH